MGLIRFPEEAVFRLLFMSFLVNNHMNRMREMVEWQI